GVLLHRFFGSKRALLARGAAHDSFERRDHCSQIVTQPFRLSLEHVYIAGRLKDEYPGNPELWVSHETIYRSLFVQARGALKKELIGHLRSKRRIRRSLHATYFGEGRGSLRSGDFDGAPLRPSGFSLTGVSRLGRLARTVAARRWRPSTSST